MGFVGVSTAQSSITRVFPVWAKILGLPTDQLTGFDLPLDASREQYREVIRRIADDPDMPGALITTHKIGVHQAAADMFAELDEFAALCGEISSVSKSGGGLIGHAKDPLTAGLALEEFLAEDHFGTTGGELLVLGAGGSGTAIIWYLTHRADAPKRVVCTDVDPGRLTALKSLLRRGGVAAEIHVADGPADALVAGLPPGSLVVNATGLGKDRPGSPVTGDVRFPRRGIVWEVNYRGSLEFLVSARDRQAADRLTVVDGWRYFVHGWSQIIAEVFGLTLDEDVVRRLSAAAEPFRR
jgi:shikimate dehydrogenase